MLVLGVGLDRVTCDSGAVKWNLQMTWDTDGGDGEGRIYDRWMSFNVSRR